MAVLPISNNDHRAARASGVARIVEGLLINHMIRLRIEAERAKVGRRWEEPPESLTDNFSRQTPSSLLRFATLQTPVRSRSQIAPLHRVMWCTAIIR